MPLPREQVYTTDDIYALPDGERAELIDGQIYMMGTPSRIHQKLVGQLSRIIGNYIESNHGSCEIYPAPFAVFIKKDDKNYVEPDIRDRKSTRLNSSHPSSSRMPSSA